MSKSPQIIDKLIGKQLYLLRLRHNIDYDKMSQILNVSRTQIQKYEQGANKISVNKLYELLHICNISFQSFFDNIEQNKHLEDPQNIEISYRLNFDKDLRSLIRLYSNIKNRSDKDVIMKIVQNFSEGDCLEK